MTTTKYTAPRSSFGPWADIDCMSSRLSRMFDDPVCGLAKGARWNPAVSVSETNEELLLTAELAGLDEENLSIEFESDVLTIAGEKAQEHEEGDAKGNYHVQERSFGSFKRSFKFPRTVDPNGITATFDQGILTVKLPKVADAKGRKISISR